MISIITYKFRIKDATTRKQLNNMAKSVYDSGWYQIKSLLKYKAIRFGVTYQEGNEMFSTITCSVCGSRSGPSGLSDLGVRNWICSSCGTQHDRDINAAKNILNVGLGH